MRFMAFPRLLIAEVGPLVVVHDGKVGLAAVEDELGPALVEQAQRVLGRSLLPGAAHHAAPAEEIDLAAGDVAHLLHVAGVAGVSRGGRKADGQVVEAELLAGELVHRLLELAGDAAVHLHFIGVVEPVVAEAGLVVVRVHDADALAGGGALHGVLGAGAVVRKAEEGGVAGVVQADACVGGSLLDLGAGGELGVLVGHVPAAAVAVGHMGVDRGVEVALAADVQAGVIVHADELGAGGALAVVVVQRLIRHQQLQELVAAGAQRADLRDGVGVVEHRAEAGDAALHLALDEHVRRTDAALRAGVLARGVGDVVHHHAHDASAAAPGLAGERVGVVSGGHGKAGVQLFPFRQRRDDQIGRSIAGCGGRGRAAQRFLEPGGEVAAQNGAACAAAGQSQRGGSGTGKAKNGTARDLHRKNLLHKKLGPAQRRSRKKHGRHGAPVRPGAPQTDLI